MPTMLKGVHFDGPDDPNFRRLRLGTWEEYRARMAVIESCPECAEPLTLGDITQHGPKHISDELRPLARMLVRLSADDITRLYEAVLEMKRREILGRGTLAEILNDP